MFILLPSDSTVQCLPEGRAIYASYHSTGLGILGLLDGLLIPCYMKIFWTRSLQEPCELWPRKAVVSRHGIKSFYSLKLHVKTFIIVSLGIHISQAYRYMLGCVLSLFKYWLNMNRAPAKENVILNSRLVLSLQSLGPRDDTDWSFRSSERLLNSSSRRILHLLKYCTPHLPDRDGCLRGWMYS